MASFMHHVGDAVCGFVPSGTRTCQSCSLLLAPAPDQAPPEPAAAKPVDEDEDIFGDAGKEYEPDLVRRDGGGNAAAAAPAQAQAKGAYFSERDDMADLPALPKPGGPDRASLESSSTRPWGFVLNCLLRVPLSIAATRAFFPISLPHTGLSWEFNAE